MVGVVRVVRGGQAVNIILEVGAGNLNVEC